MDHVRDGKRSGKNLVKGEIIDVGKGVGELRKIRWTWNDYSFIWNSNLYEVYVCLIDNLIPITKLRGKLLHLEILSENASHSTELFKNAIGPHLCFHLKEDVTSNFSQLENSTVFRQDQTHNLSL